MPARRTNHLLQLVPQRLNRLIARIEPLRWRTIAELPVTAGALHAAWPDLATAQQEPHSPLRAGSHLGSGWQRRWCRVEVPAGEGERQLWWRCQGETTAWLNGQPWAGLDVGHPRCPLPAAGGTLWLALGTWQTGLWVPGATAIGPQGARFDGCTVVARNAAADACLGDLDVLRQLVQLLISDAGLEAPATIGWCENLDRVDPLLRLLLGGLDAAGDAFDLGGLEALAPALVALRQKLPASPWSPKVAMVAQSHIDLVYLWPERVGLEKAIHTCSTQLRLLDTHPAYRFTHSQPLQYRQLEREAPGLMAAIRTRIAEGRWEVTGGFACEPDTNMPCGEALLRSLRVGQQITTELTGEPGRVCWLPDVFGYNACLPALLKLAGITGFVTTKLAWSSVTRFPWSSFVWRGHDGSEVVAHLVPVGYNTGAHEGVKALVTAARAYREVHIHDELLVAVGFGDGGGGPDEALLGFTARAGNLAGLPRAAWSRADAFIDRLATVQDALPVHQGELYLEGHRGVLTTQQRFKRAYRGLEQALQAWEAARCATKGGAVDDYAWERLFFAQFHDALPGSSIALVYEELSPELEAIAERCRASAVADLGGAGVLPFNPLPFARLVRHAGQTWHCPGLSTGTVVTPATTATAATFLDNDLLRVEFSGGDVRAIAGLPLAGACFTLAEDHPANYDAWEIDRQSLRYAQRVGPTELTVAGPGRLRGTCRLGERSTLTVDYVLLPGERHLRIEAEVDWREDHRLLRFEIDSRCRGASARFGCPFGSVLRPQQPGGPQAEAQWEVAGSRWAAALDDAGSDGVALLTANHWGFSCRDGHLGVSLLRAPTYPDAQADRGVHRLQCAIGAYAPAFAGDVLPTAAAADALFTAPLLIARPVSTALPAASGSLVPAWAQPTANGAELRLHEVAGRAGPDHGPYAIVTRPL